MHRLILILLVLAACGPRPDAPVANQSFRPAQAPIYSSAVLEPRRLSGGWVQVATFSPGGGANCPAGRVDFDNGAVQGDLCLAEGMKRVTGPLTPGKPGRLAIDGMADWWVLWVDADYRTLVVGTPSGRFGFVLNRDASIPSDRLTAVRDILLFNGYAMENMALLN